MGKIAATALLVSIFVIHLAHAATPEDWITKVQRASQAKFLLTTKNEVLKSWGVPDQNLPEASKAKGVIQYLYEGDRGLPAGCLPAIRFSFDDKGRLIEVSLGFAFGPPVQGGR